MGGKNDGQADLGIGTALNQFAWADLGIGTALNQFAWADLGIGTALNRFAWTTVPGETFTVLPIVLARTSEVPGERR